MSYPTIENGVAAGRPQELYRFALNAARWTYASGQEAVVYQSETYQPASIRRGGIEQGNEINRAGLEIVLARDNPLATLFIASPPEGVVSVTVYRRHASDPDADTIVLWKGRVGGARLAGSDLTLKCEPVASSLKRLGLRARYSLICRHALYGAGCGALKETYRVDGAISAVTGTSVEVAEAASRPDGHFVAGMLATDKGQRMIVGHAGVRLTLVAPLASLAPGMAVRLYAGCDHATGTCNGRFANLANYGGFPFIPTKNPFSGDAIV